MDWFMKQRQAYISEVLAERGYIQRGDIASAFDVTVLTASKDIALYTQINPGIIDYNYKTKRYEVRK